MITSATGILIAAMIIFMQFVTDRKLRKYDMLQTALLSLEEKKIDNLTLSEHERDEFLEKISDRIGQIQFAQGMLLHESIAVNICHVRIRLNLINYGLLVLLLLVFMAALIYMGVISTHPGLIRERALYALGGLTVIGFIAFLPVARWSAAAEQSSPPRAQT